MKRDPWGLVLLILCNFCFWMSGFYFGVECEQENAVVRGRCQHERMANYDLVLAETECMELRKQIERTKESLAKSIEFMDQVKEKLGE